MRVGGPLPFIGRASEAATLRSRAIGLTSAARRIQLVKGAAGVGKTRLVAEALAGIDPKVIWVRCWDHSESLWPWLRVLEQLGRSLPDRPSTDRVTLFAALTDALQGCGPLVVVLDDLHLTDDLTILFTRFLARSEAAPDVLVIVTTRPTRELVESRATALAELARETDELSLTNLDRADAMRLFEAGGVDLDDGSLVEALLAMTRGLPLAIERTAMAAGRLGGREADLTEIVDRAARHLSATARQLLGSAAVYGPVTSVAELRTGLGCSEADALEAVRAGADAGVIEPTTRAELVFTHDLVRQAVSCWLSPSERAGVHRGAVQTLTDGGPARLPLAAEHAVALAAIDPAFSDEAIGVLLAAAEHHRSIGALESALECCDRAVALADRSGASLPARDRLSHANAALAAGQLLRARDLYRLAATAGEVEREMPTFADAAIGLSGIWLGEHRDEHAALEVRARQQRALRAIGPHDARRALRLRVRLAGEAAYQSRHLAELDRLVDETRSTGTRRALAEALSISIHARLGPASAIERRELVDELVAVAAEAGDPLTVLLAQCWRAVTLAIAGDDGALRARRALELRCFTIRCASIQFIIDAMAVGDLIGAGRFDEAEFASDRCFAFGQSVGDADAWTYYAGHLAAIRYFQGRHDELAAFAADASTSPATLTGERALATTASYFALHAGDREPALRIVAAHARRPEVASYQPSTWLVAMHALARISLDLDDRELGAEIATRLAPHRELPTSISMAVGDLGPVAWSYGIALAAAGQLDDADAALAAAVELARRRGQHPAAVIAAADRAVVVHRIGRRPEATALLESAIEEADRRSMTGWVKTWSELRGRWQTAATVITPGFERIDQRSWRCTFGVASVVVPHAVGVQYLATLCASPDVEISASRLAYLAEPNETRHDIVDSPTLTALRRRAESLQRDIDDGTSDRGQAEDELDAVTAQLVLALGLDSRRSFAHADERARTSVRKAITRAIAGIEQGEPAIASHLAGHIRTGHQCSYSSSVR